MIRPWVKSIYCAVRTEPSPIILSRLYGANYTSYNFLSHDSIAHLDPSSSCASVLSFHILYCSTPLHRLVHLHPQLFQLQFNTRKLLCCRTPRSCTSVLHFNFNTSISTLQFNTLFDFSTLLILLHALIESLWLYNPSIVLYFRILACCPYQDFARQLVASPAHLTD